MNYIYYQTKTKFVNTGDALINKALIDSLRNYGVLECNCSKEVPQYFLDELGIKQEEKIEAKSELTFIFSILKHSIKKNKSDNIYIFSGLGHNFGGSFKKIIRNILTGLFIFPIYRLFGVKIIRIGMSIGPITKKLAISEKIRSIPINYYYVRDDKSLKLCHDIGIKKAKLCPDLSWIYLKNYSRKINNIKDNSIIICLRDSMFDMKDVEYKKQLINSLDVLLDKMNSKGNLKIMFMYQVTEDKDFTIELYDRYKDKYDCEFDEKQVRLKEAQNKYSKYKFNISNRMHSILLGYKYGSFPIVLTDLSRHTKISQTLKDNNIEEIGFDIKNSNLEINDIYDNYEYILNKIYAVEEKNQQTIISILDKIFNIDE